VPDPGCRRGVRENRAAPHLVLVRHRWHAQQAALHAEHAMSAGNGGIERGAIVRVAHHYLGSRHGQPPG
jgi:hypothetical protein